MTELTKKQKAFVTHKVAGCTNKDAALAAGYAPGSAAQAGDRLAKHPAVRAAIKGAGGSNKAVPGVSAPTMPRKHYADPMAFLLDVMNHAELPIVMRADAAKQLLPYQHARMGEQGKKASKKERAAEIAKGRHKFATKVPPPHLTVVRND